MASNFNWSKKSVLITGGASFIGSSLVEALVQRGALIRVVDDLSSGHLKNIDGYIKSGKVNFINGDLKKQEIVKSALDGIDIVFHLAADHGGRGYVDLHQAGPASNLFLDGMLFWHAKECKVEKVIFASSGCVYPNYLQSDTSKELYLSEDMVGPPYDADNMYGWAKLMAELTLKSYYKEYGLKAASCRYFTVYGPKGVENHAVIAMIARAFVKQNPFEVWGDGNQIRNWTYIDDIVEGTILAAEKISDGTAVNLGTRERIKVIDAVKMILEYTGHKAEINYRLDMPIGPLNRVADNTLAKKLLGWEPKVKFKDGLKKTINWYYSSKSKEQISSSLEKILTER